MRPQVDAHESLRYCDPVCVESAPAEPSVQEPGIKGVSAACAIHDIDLPCFAEKTRRQ